MRLYRLTVVLLAALLLASPAVALEVGDPAPAFELKGSDGNTYSLKDQLEKYRGVVLAWFPKAFTPG